ncbi:hypothetical protein [Lactiplantibacillus songbeiensis]|uniref:Cell surface protein n=1 Tax=Lactiplantibacillus songbeiensis TaxID=2559920 RepID=A0ABW4C2R9_9LACO|nr:hypothetical protein [Lactiplantibacillus songbeiensis]
MRRFRRLLAPIGLLLGSLIAMGWSQSLVSQAADTMTAVSFTKATSITGDSLYGGDTSLSSAPAVTQILANNVENGKLTNRTTVLSITYSGTLTTKNSRDTVKNLYASAFNADSNVAGLINSTNLIPGSLVKTFTFSSSNATQTVGLDWSVWNGTALSIGLRYTNQLGDESGRALAYISKDSIVEPKVLTPTITTDLTQSTTVIEGKGTIVGDKITVDADPSVSTTVGADLSYSLKLSKSLAGQKTVVVTESNDAGDSGTVSKDVAQKTLTLDNKETSLATGPNDITSSMSNSDVLAWITKQAGLSATYSDGSSTADVTYTSDATGLAAKIAALASGDSMTVDVYAQDGSTKSSSQTITIKKTAGTLSFGTISGSIGFGTLAIPTKEAIYQPSSKWDVNISDTRATGSKWYVYASATELESDSHKLKGNLIYQDGSNQSVLTNQSTLVASGSRGTTNTTAVTSDWSSTKGIFLDVQPSVYADSYQGKVNWSLQSTPTE